MTAPGIEPRPSRSKADTEPHHYDSLFLTKEFTYQKENIQRPRHEDHCTLQNNLSTI